MDWTGGGKGTPLCFLGPRLTCQAGGQHTELLEDFSPLSLWVSHPGPRQLEDPAAHEASEERLYYQTGLKNRGPVCVEHLRGAESCLALDRNSAVTALATSQGPRCSHRCPSLSQVDQRARTGEEGRGTRLAAVPEGEAQTTPRGSPSCPQTCARRRGSDLAPGGRGWLSQQSASKGDQSPHLTQQVLGSQSFGI